MRTLLFVYEDLPVCPPHRKSYHPVANHLSDLIFAATYRDLSLAMTMLASLSVCRDGFESRLACHKFLEIFRRFSLSCYCQNRYISLPLRVLTSPAQYHTWSNIFQVEAQPGLGDQGSSHPRQGVSRPSWLLGSLEADLLSDPNLFAKTKTSVREHRIFIHEARTLLLVFNAAPLLNIDTSFSQVGASSGVILFRYSCNSASWFLHV